ncbi:hypothetical protein HD806DRAFT_39225 [Xylariaceae sp. AK1471]|nr:hypothetical protein HD806DRAFT_39225 [Xylariaceae sp. AK1471]
MTSLFVITTGSFLFPIQLMIPVSRPYYLHLDVGAIHMEITSSLYTREIFVEQYFSEINEAILLVRVVEEKYILCQEQLKLFDRARTRKGNQELSGLEDSLRNLRGSHRTSLTVLTINIAAIFGL